MRLVVSRRAAVVPEARSKRPASGLATVPTTPFGIPVRNPWKQEGMSKLVSNQSLSLSLSLSLSHSHSLSLLSYLLSTHKALAWNTTTLFYPNSRFLCSFVGLCDEGCYSTKYTTGESHESSHEVATTRLSTLNNLLSLFLETGVKRSLTEDVRYSTR